MKVKMFSFHPYTIPLSNGSLRHGILINITDERGNSAWGEVAPLPKWSQETLEEAIDQLVEKKQSIIDSDWVDASQALKRIEQLELFPSVEFGLESALLSLLSPMSEHPISVSALLMGSPKEILEQAHLRHLEGYTSAKLKVSNLSFTEAGALISQLKNQFRLRIDVNKAWKTEESLKFFEQFPLGTFDYVEEPFQNSNDLPLFPHPLGIDESFPQCLNLKQLDSLPMLKALIYKPTIQGGMRGCLFLREWTAIRGIKLILGGSFESDLGLAHIASMAYRLSLSEPIGIGTYHYLTKRICDPALQFSQSLVHIPHQIEVTKANL